MDLAHLARLKEAQELAYSDTQEKITQWSKFNNDYSVLQDRLKKLPDKVTHEVMVPFGPLAFMPGQIIHSNEVMVLLGDNWFAERSAKQACDIIDRRKQQIDTTLKELKEQKRLLGDRLGFTSEFKEISENKEDMVDIQEEYDPEKERLWREERKRRKQQGAATKPKQQDTPADSKQPSKTDHIRSKITSPNSTSSTKHQGDRTKDASVKLHQNANDHSGQSQSSDTQRSGQGSKVERKDEIKVEARTKTASDEERLLARLDELERQEDEMDELARLSDYDEVEDQDQPMFSFTQEADPEEPPSKMPPKQLQRSNSSEKRVQWMDQQDTESACSSSDDDVVTSTIHFSHTKADEQQDTTRSSRDELTSPADIYNQYVAMQPFPEEKLSASASSLSASASSASSSAIESAQSPPLMSILKPARQPASPEPVKEKPPKQILPQLDSVFSGSIVERTNITMPTQPETQPVEDEPPKRMSKFKAARQQKKR